MNNKENLASWRKKKIAEFKPFPKYLLYLSRKQNFKSIIENGILPHNQTKDKKLKSQSFADVDVQELRSRIDVHISGEKKYNLHDLVPLYFQALTPTLSVIRKHQEDLFFCKISSQNLISDTKIDFAFTDGNAASLETIKYRSLNSLKKLNWTIINSEFWNDKVDGKRIRNSEFLIYPKIEIKYISEFSVNNQKLKQEFENELQKKSLKIPVTIDNNCFFHHNIVNI
tara:strand:- start:358 stop:1038 length:681 start_codon:yes stop_codon:yes gene_type:complete